MSNNLRWALVVAAPLIAAACGVLPDVSLGADDGIPAVQGSTAIDIPQDFKCGDPLTDPNNKYTVTTAGTADACSFTFRQDATVIKSSDYDSNPALRGAQLIQRVDFEVKALGVKDASTDKPLDPESTLKDLTGTALGTTIFTKADLRNKTPFTKSVEGAPVEELKSLVEAKKDIVIPVEVVVVVALTPEPPAKVGLDFDAQPNIIVGF
jgi:hypothetical protein